MERKWSGSWICFDDSRPYFGDASSMPYFRSEFDLEKDAGKVVVHLCGLGFHELYINGKRPDSRFYAPSLSQYDCRVGYIDYDVTELVQPGKNAIVVFLGDGFYNSRNKWMYSVNCSSWRAFPRLICDIEADGKIIACSGTAWRVHGSPVIRSCHHEGEDYDARLELEDGAFLPGFDDSGWNRASHALSPGGNVVKEEGPPCVVISRHEGCEIIREDAGLGTRLFDIGTNIAGVAEIEFSGPAGTKLTIRYGEMLGEDGHVDTSGISMGIEDFEKDTYILKGAEAETWHPVFVWHGFRYVEIYGAENVEIRRVTGLFIASGIETAGTFRSSDEMLNRVQKITLNSYLGNYMGIPTDCPTREKFGWTGDAACALETGLWNFDCGSGLERLAQIIADLQRRDGNYPTHGPTTLWGFEQSCPGYSRYMYDYCYCMYLFRGDMEPVKRYYDSLMLGISFFGEQTREDGLVRTFGYGDWCNPDYYPAAPKGEKRDFVPSENCLYFRMLTRMAEMADWLGKADDAGHCREQAEIVKNALLKEYFDCVNMQFDEGMWASTAMAVLFGIVPAESCGELVRRLAEDIRRAGHCARMGILGTQFVQTALTEYGYGEDAFRMAVQDKYPGWGNLVASGATTLWETWKGNSSRNHIMFGGVSAWMYSGLAGMYPLAPGFSRVRLAPCIVPGLVSVSAEYMTPLGRLCSSWEQGEGICRCSFNLPEGAVGVVSLPGISEEINGYREYSFKL